MKERINNAENYADTVLSLRLDMGKSFLAVSENDTPDAVRPKARLIGLLDVQQTAGKRRLGSLGVGFQAG